MIQNEDDNIPYSRTTNSTSLRELDSQNFDNDNCGNTIKIYIFQPPQRLQHIIVNSLSPINTLRNLYHGEKAFIFEGTIVNKNATFDSYGIKNDSKLVMIPEQSLNNTKLTEHLLDLTKNKPAFDWKIKMNSKHRKETARINDLKICQFERRNRVYFLKACHNMKQNNSYLGSSLCYNSSDQLDSTQTDKLNLNYEPEAAPSIEPLPVFW